MRTKMTRSLSGKGNEKVTFAGASGKAAVKRVYLTGDQTQREELLEVEADILEELLRAGLNLDQAVKKGRRIMKEIFGLGVIEHIRERAA